MLHHRSKNSLTSYYPPLSFNFCVLPFHNFINTSASTESTDSAGVTISSLWPSSMTFHVIWTQFTSYSVSGS